MQSHSRIWLENDEIDNDADGDMIDADDLDTTVHVDVSTGRIMFQAAWAEAADPPPETARHSVVLVLDCDTMERYADLDEHADARARDPARHGGGPARAPARRTRDADGRVDRCDARRRAPLQ